VTLDVDKYFDFIRSTLPKVDVYSLALIFYRYYMDYFVQFNYEDYILTNYLRDILIQCMNLRFMEQYNVKMVVEYINENDIQKLLQ